MTDLFAYLDYRHYLKDYYQSMKEKKGAAFSFRSFARLAGLKSPNFLQLVMEGKRNLSHASISLFSKALKHNKEESRYFESLVQFNQAKNDLERNRWYQELSASKRYQEVREIEKDYYVYFSRWYYAAMRELVLLKDFKEDPEWISKKLKPRITPKEAAVGIDLLLRIGFLKRDEKGKLIQADRNITTAREVQSLAISNYHQEMMQRASETIDRTLPQQRDISSLTVAMSPKKFAEAKRRIQEFRRELNVLLSTDSEKDPFDAVYQINFQIFNLTEVPWKSS